MSLSYSKILKKNLDQKIGLNLLNKSESLKISVIYQSKTYFFSWGKNYKFYDLASLTKPIFTVAACMVYQEFYGSLVHRRVDEILPWFENGRHENKNIKVLDLLSHQSGAPALYPVFKDLKQTTISGLEPLSALLRNITFEHKAPVYSDVGFFILGAVLEKLFNKPLVLIFEDLRNYFDLGHLHFNPLSNEFNNFQSIRPKHKVNHSIYAPTEECPLRQKKIQGEVHDENCWKMGGVGPHAGLFGTIEDVTYWVLNFMKVFKAEMQFKKSTTDLFLKKQKGDWRLGFMLPSKPSSSSGSYFSKDSYGHLGFTGTSFWVDPKKDLGVVILSNRTYPNRENKDFNSLRPLIHNCVWESLR